MSLSYGFRMLKDAHTVVDVRILGEALDYEARMDTSFEESHLQEGRSMARSESAWNGHFLDRYLLSWIIILESLMARASLTMIMLVISVVIAVEPKPIPLALQSLVLQSRILCLHCLNAWDLTSDQRPRQNSAIHSATSPALSLTTLCPASFTTLTSNPKSLISFSVLKSSSAPNTTKLGTPVPFALT